MLTAMKLEGALAAFFAESTGSGGKGIGFFWFHDYFLSYYKRLLFVK